MTIDRFAQLPRDLARRAKSVRLGDVPVLLAHPDWENPAPVMLWLHGRTANKELDPGRYLRWVRSGIAACAIDLPGHGERSEPERQEGPATLGVIEQALGEIDGVLRALRSEEWKGVFDLGRCGIGGMSLGGMITLRRLCEEHPFRCAAVEATTGDLQSLYAGTPAADDSPLLERLDPARHLDFWRPIPLLALHSEADELVPWAIMKGFLDRLGRRYAEAGVDRSLIETVTWPTTGAPKEHLGFGSVASQAKDVQAAFLSRRLVEAAGHA